MSDASTGSPAGNPSTMTTSARPCDSPAVKKRSTQQRYRNGNGVPGLRFRTMASRRHRGAARPAPLIEGVLPAPVVGHVEHAGQLGNLLEERSLDPLPERHL